jgi:hypothetical protein
MWNPLNFIRRPNVDDQTTAHLAYQQSYGYALAGYVGNGGHEVLRSMNATNPATIAVGQTLRTIDPTATGNNALSLNLNPLSKNNLNADADYGNVSNRSF